MRKLRIALVGAGAFGPELGRYIQRDPRAEITCVCDANPTLADAAVARLGIAAPTVQEYAAVLQRKDVDAVVLCTPNHTHAPLAIAAARAGKHIFCEKPMALSVADCRAMVEAAEAARVKLMVGHKRRLRPPWARLIELATNGRLGQVVAVNVNCFHRNTYVDQVGGSWLKKELGGGLLHLVCPHVIDVLNAICAPDGEPADSVSAVTGPQQDGRFDFPDIMSVTIRYRSGALATLQVSLGYALRRFRENCGPWIQLTHGAIELHPASDCIDLTWQHVDDAQPHREHFDDLGFDAAYAREIGEFVRWVQDDVPPSLTWREGYRVVEIIEAAERSVASGGAIVKP